MHRKQVIHSNGSYERKSPRRKLAYEMGRARKIPMVHYRVMHRKRVTSELHDSYLRLMTIKHSISKNEWASNDYIIELSSRSQSSCQESSRQLKGVVVGKATPDRGDPREPRWSGPQHQENKKDTTWQSQQWGQNIAVMFDLQLPLTCNPWTTLSNPCNKVRGKILLKKSSCVFLPASSFLRRYHCVVVNYSTYICACM